MCGRYSITTPSEALRRIFGFVERPNLQARYNVAPTQEVPAVRLGDDRQRHLVMLRWGLIPAWAKDARIGSRMINARAETLLEKPVFRKPLGRRRCLVVADGFYEWRKLEGGAKQPYRIALPDGAPFAFAGLWESWRGGAGGETVESCTIVTTASRGAVAAIHHRMPVILAPDRHEAWLKASGDAEAAQALLAPDAGVSLVAYPVSKRVNKVSNDDPGVIERLETADGGPTKNEGSAPLPLFD